MNKQMTEKQKRFCDYYLETGVASEAYKMAYKSCKKDETARVNGSRLLTNANVSEYINERLKQIENKRIAKPKEVMEYLSKVMRGEEKDQFGLDATLSDRTKAAELLGKRYRMFTEKVDVNSNVGVTIIDDIPVDDSNE